MKLVELLARELKEWPERTVEYVQGEDGCWPLSFSGARFEDSTWILKAGQTTGSRGDVLHIDMASDYKKARVTRAQWQAERDRQKGGEWKRHRGNKLPIDGGLYIEAKLRCGDIQRGYAQDFIWPHSACDVEVNLMKYRVISQPQVEEVEVNVRVDSSVNVEYAFGAPDADMSKLDWRALGACNLDSIEFPTKGEIIHGPISMGDEVIAPSHPKWGQVDGPLLWRDTVNELDAYIEEFTREREALINRLALEGFALIEKINLNLDKIDATLDMSDWRNWKVGDLVTSKVDYNHQFTKGKKYKVTGTNMYLGEKRVSVESDDKGKANGWLANQFEFHSRP